MSLTDNEWLSSAEASELLGVHQTTLRRWADAGEVPCFRTPGGHRRFRTGDLEAWMEGRQSTGLALRNQALVQEVVGFTRHEMVEQQVSKEGWYLAFDRQDERQHMRETGHRLLGLAIQYMARTSHHEPALQEGQRIGAYYGRECAGHGISLVDTVRGFFFFRESLLQATQPGLATRAPYDAEEVQMHRRLQRFLDEVMYACLGSYEAACHQLFSPAGAA